MQRKLWLGGVIATALTVGTLALTGGGVSTAAPQDPGACGNDVVDVPDTGVTFDFTSACVNHDACYAVPGTELDRKACDDAFLAEMNASCGAMWPGQFFKRLTCNSVAGAYYVGVRLGAWAFYPYE